MNGVNLMLGRFSLVAALYDGACPHGHSVMLGEAISFQKQAGKVLKSYN